MMARPLKRLSLFSLAWALFTVWVLAATSQAMGRRSSEDADGFPDYNRLEMRPKPPEAPAEEPAPPSAAPLVRPTLNNPFNLPSDVDAAPKPQASVPMPVDSSEPALPDDMMHPLVAPATGQK
jgi:hypothetical protein